MKKFRITASYTVFCYATIDAEDEDQAYDIARDMDGGDFEPERDSGISDWYINEVREIPPDSD